MVENLKIFFSSHLLSRCYWLLGKRQFKKKNLNSQVDEANFPFRLKGFRGGLPKNSFFSAKLFIIPTTTKKNTKGKTSPKKNSRWMCSAMKQGESQQLIHTWPKTSFTLEVSTASFVGPMCMYINIYYYIHLYLHLYKNKKTLATLTDVFFYSQTLSFWNDAESRNFEGSEDFEETPGVIVQLPGHWYTNRQCYHIWLLVFTKCWGNCSPSRLTQVFTFHVTHLPKHRFDPPWPHQHSDLWFDANQEVQMLSYHRRVGWIHKTGVCAKSGNLAKGIRSEKGLISSLVSWFQGCFGRFFAKFLSSKSKQKKTKGLRYLGCVFVHVLVLFF